MNRDLCILEKNNQVAEMKSEGEENTNSSCEHFECEHGEECLGAFTLGSIAWSEPEFVCSPLLLPPLDCVHIILFGSEPQFVCVIKPAAVYPVA